MRWVCIFAYCGLLVANADVLAYQLKTHADLSQAALQASVLNQPSSAGVLTDLGLQESINVTRQFPNSNGAERSITELIQDGARFEDNIPGPLNHFYDPVNNRPLTVGGITLGRTSPDWALEDSGQITGILGVGAQEFSFTDARGYLFKALISASETDRKKNFGLTFQTLGQVIHHIQDMAQPQHVRNDQHIELSLIQEIGLCTVSPVVCGAYFAIKNPSLYESYTATAPLKFDGYPPVYSVTDPNTFNITRNFWHTPEGKGMADFTNRNFVSAGTNFDKPGLFPSPVRDESNKVDIDIDFQQFCQFANPPCPNPTPNLSGVITFYGNLVDDKFTGATVNNPFASSLSIFDADLRQAAGGNALTQPLVFTLNRFNFDVALNLLIPRAVGYSAGMINYFFRGKIDIVPNPDPNNPGSFIIKNLGNEAMSGNFTLYYDAIDNNRFPVAGAVNGAASTGNVTWPNLTIPAQGQSSEVLTFTPPISPAPKTPIVYTLVFNGDMGEEKADASNGVVGAVVAKELSLYNGVLYLAGQDSASNVQFFKVDKNGVSMLQPNEFNPLAPPIATSGVVTEKSYFFKQVVFTPTLSGDLLHKTISLVQPDSIINSSPTQRSFVSNAVFGGPSLSGIVWTAQSIDPAVGAFQFNLSSFGSQARLGYVRRYTDAQGKVALAFGSVPLPELSNNTFSNLQRLISNGLLFVSGDGTDIYPRGSTSGLMHGIHITLDVNPSIALFDLPQPAATTTTNNPAFSNGSNIGQCSLDYIGNPSGNNPVPLTATSEGFQSEILKVDFQQTQHDIVIVDFLRGILLSYTEQTQIRLLDDTVSSGCQIAVEDFSTGTFQPKFRFQINIQAEKISRTVVEEDLPNGSFQNVVDSFSIFPAQAELICGQNSDGIIEVGPFPSKGQGFINLSYNYSGFSPCPNQPATAYSGSILGGGILSGSSIYRVLTDRSDDAVYFDSQNGGRLLKFRSNTLDGPFIADASPIGEVFLATSDLSLIVHEPKPGNMPVLSRDMIPSGIVKLLAVVWM